MKIFQQSAEFDYSWEEVSTANWRKYGPWNEKTPHVIAVDTLSRTIDPETGIVRRSLPLVHALQHYLTCLDTVTNRASHHMQAVHTEMDKHNSWWRRHVAGI